LNNDRHAEEFTAHVFARGHPFGFSNRKAECDAASHCAGSAAFRSVFDGERANGFFIDRPSS
jgi:hypothetical protein